MPSAISTKSNALPTAASDSSVKIKKKDEQGLSTKSTLSPPSKQTESKSEKPSALTKVCTAVKNFFSTIFYYITFQWLCKKTPASKNETSAVAPKTAVPVKKEEQKTEASPSIVSSKKSSVDRAHTKKSERKVVFSIPSTTKPLTYTAVSAQKPFSLSKYDEFHKAALSRKNSSSTESTHSANQEHVQPQEAPLERKRSTSSIGSTHSDNQEQVKPQEAPLERKRATFSIGSTSELGALQEAALERTASLSSIGSIAESVSSIGSIAEHEDVENEASRFMESIQYPLGTEEQSAIINYLNQIPNANFRTTAFKSVSEILLKQSEAYLRSVENTLTPNLKNIKADQLTTNQPYIDQLDRAAIELVRTVAFCCKLSCEVIPHKMTEDHLENSRFDKKYPDSYVVSNGSTFRPHEAILIQAATSLKSTAALFEALNESYPLLKQTTFTYTHQLLQKRVEDFSDYYLEMPLLILESNWDEAIHEVLDSWNVFDRLRNPSQELADKTPLCLRDN